MSTVSLPNEIVAPVTEDVRMPLTSHDVLRERIDQLRRLFPEAFAEGKVDFDKLRQALGDEVDTQRERYGLSWAGKSEAIRNIQTLSVGTLLPCPEESVNFDTTENLVIEGDNLEVLKLLQKSYYGKVKLIYIDPPYNTGHEFIYPDNYREGLEEYLRYSGQTDAEGVRQSTNAETAGRFHSKWLSMMYPRLFLARNLRRGDGVIFVSIDDHEVATLRSLMDEVFGEKNFVACVVWQHSVQPKGYLETVSNHHNYLLCYQRSEQFALAALPRTEEHNKNYANPDNDPKGPWRTGDVRNSLYRPNLIYDITTPSGKVIKPPENGWRWSKETMAAKIASGEVVFVDDETRIIRKIHLSTLEGRTPESLWFGKEVGTTREAAQELKELFGGESPFDTPKPTRLVSRMIQISGALEADDIVLDFFAGSCTTAHAVLAMNHEDGGARRFIMIQLPEPVDHAGGYRTIADIGKERVRRAITAMQKEASGQLNMKDRDQPEDLGFKVFKLSSSNFKIWEGDKTPADAAAMGEQLKLFADHVLQERTEQSILYELILKAGLPLTAKIETKTTAGNTVYSIADGMLLICLANPITQECLRDMIELQPQRVVCLDSAFQGNDQLKTNTVLEMKSHGIEFRTV